MRCFVEDKIIITQHRYGNEPVRASVIQRDKQSCLCHAVYATVEHAANLLSKISGNQPVNGFPLSLHCPTLSHRDRSRNFVQGCFLLGGYAAGTKAKAADQCAMDDQVCVPANGRGKVRIA